MIKSATEIPLAVKKAFYIATSGRPGPVVIDIPKDITNPADLVPYEYPKDLKLRSYMPATRGHPGQIKKAVSMMMAAERPMMYAGGGVIQGNGCEQLDQLTRMLGFPITNTLMGLGAYPATDNQFLGMLGMHGTLEANNAMHHCDVLIAIGARFDDRITNTVSKFCPQAKIIHVDVDPASISKTVMADVPIVGPVESVLREMIDMVRQVIGERKEEKEERGGGKSKARIGEIEDQKTGKKVHV